MNDIPKPGREKHTASLSWYEGIARHLLVVFCSLATPMVAFMVFLNPSGMPDPAMPLSAAVPLIAIATLFAAFILWRIAMTRRPIEFFVSNVVGLGVYICFFLLGEQVHRDFHSLYFMQILSVLILFLANRELVARLARPDDGGRGVCSLARVVILIVFAWIILMGYSIVTRAEPRYRECIVYNLYNTTLGFALFMVGADFRIIRRHRLVIGYDRACLDDIDITSLLTKREREFLVLFARIDNEALACANLNRDRCRVCGGEVKASRCKIYKKTQEAISNLDKVLRAFGMGKVEGPANKRDILHEGWKLSFDSDFSLLESIETVVGASIPESLPNTEAIDCASPIIMIKKRTDDRP